MWSQLQYEDPEEKSLSFNKIRKGISENLDLSSNIGLRDGWGPSTKNKTYICIYLESIYMEIWHFKFGVHMHSLEVVKAHRLDDECVDN